MTIEITIQKEDGSKMMFPSSSTRWCTGQNQLVEEFKRLFKANFLLGKWLFIGSNVISND